MPDIRNLLLCLITGFLVTGCDPHVNVERLAAEELYSVSSIISPGDSLIQVYVYRGRPLGTLVRSDSAIIDNAEVIISDGDNKYLLRYNYSLGRYIISGEKVKIQENKRYQLRIKLPDNYTIEAFCLVPKELIAPLVQGNRNKDDYNFTVSWAKDATFRYFMITYEMVDVKVPFNPDPRDNPSFPLVANEQAVYDREANQLGSIDQTLRNAFKADNISLKVSLYSFDSDLYQYLKTLNRFKNWQANADEFVPNLREPQPVYSNVVGGYGIFGAYVKRDTIIKIK
jgi:hypothetical protein